MKSFGALACSAFLTAMLILYNVQSFYNKFTIGNTYYWINVVLVVIFLISFIIDIKNIIKKNYKTSESN
ncbi:MULTISPECIES: hypothetical protein [Bacillus]|uniref:Chorismate synthase n=2 Tax=Bacillus cereus group TaxID=86661 RepID=A0ABV3IBR2_9BACI|nr:MULTISPECIES: hypothetical protein [Bacillus cereus group]MCQ6358851.1 hypothetical protein [Bacillus cereus]MBJ8107486.1 hypothetical protein [Bacillus cereus group sp. N8]MDM5436575.1 hypothetical protein [Bacillus hominis]MED1512033.1 hypothetical protein [Bacillus proteolyticus]SCB69155.1 Uncharacterized protein BWGO95_03307 [Bacillus mycoides]